MVPEIQDTVHEVSASVERWLGDDLYTEGHIAHHMTPAQIAMALIVMAPTPSDLIDYKFGYHQTQTVIPHRAMATIAKAHATYFARRKLLLNSTTL